MRKFFLLFVFVLLGIHVSARKLSFEQKLTGVDAVWDNLWNAVTLNTTAPMETYLSVFRGVDKQWKRLKPVEQAAALGIFEKNSYDLLNNGEFESAVCELNKSLYLMSRDSLSCRQIVLLGMLYYDAGDLYSLYYAKELLQAYQLKRKKIDVSTHIDHLQQLYEELKAGIGYADDLCGVWISDYKSNEPSKKSNKYTPYLVIRIDRNGADYNAQLIPGCEFQRIAKLKPGERMDSVTFGFIDGRPDTLSICMVHAEFKEASPAGAMVGHELMANSREIAAGHIARSNLSSSEKILAKTGADAFTMGLDLLFHELSVPKHKNVAIDLSLSADTMGILHGNYAMTIHRRRVDNGNVSIKSDAHKGDITLYKLYPDEGLLFNPGMFPYFRPVATEYFSKAVCPPFYSKAVMMQNKMFRKYRKKKIAFVIPSVLVLPMAGVTTGLIRRNIIKSSYEELYRNRRENVRLVKKVSNIQLPVSYE